MKWRGALAIGAVAWVASACGPKAPSKPPGPPPVPLHVEPACDLAPAAGLDWIVEAKPRAIAEIPDLIPSIAMVVGEDRFKVFAASHGGLDMRQIQDLCVARYRDAVLAVARAPIDTNRVANAFESRSARQATRNLVVPNPPVLRMSGEVNGEPQQLLVLGREAVALEEGRPGPLRAAEAFALGKLRRASPALRGAALRRASEILGDAPVRAFAPGPFEGQTAQGLGGLLRASTAVAASARHAGSGARITVKLVLTGAWGDDAAAAAERLAAATHVVADSSVGRLFALDRPIETPRVRGEADALVLETTLDAVAIARGLHDALDAEVADIMRR